jgi:hypothetical protein
MTTLKKYDSFFADTGSIAPLGLGLFLFSLIFCLTTVGATSLFIFQKRLTSLAESSALYVASGYGESADFLNSVGSLNFDDLRVVNSLAADELTTVVKACATWHAPLITLGEFSKLKICSTGLARSGF